MILIREIIRTSQHQSHRKNQNRSRRTNPLLNSMGGRGSDGRIEIVAGGALLPAATGPRRELSAFESDSDFCEQRPADRQRAKVEAIACHPARYWRCERQNAADQAPGSR